MDAPEELRQTVAKALAQDRSRFPGYLPTVTHRDLVAADVMLAVPAIAVALELVRRIAEWHGDVSVDDALERDRKVTDIVKGPTEYPNGQARKFLEIRNLHSTYKGEFDI